MSEHDLCLSTIFVEAFVAELEFSFGTQADGTNYGVVAKFLLVVTVPSHSILPISIIIDQDGIELDPGNGFDGLLDSKQFLDPRF